MHTSGLHTRQPRYFFPRIAHQRDALLGPLARPDRAVSGSVPHTRSLMSTFADMNLPQSLAQRLTQAGLTTPTPGQQAAIPLALKGRGIMAQAKTRSGKKLAVLLPIIVQGMRRGDSMPAPGAYSMS